jgi:competence protein ComGC
MKKLHVIIVLLILVFAGSVFSQDTKPRKSPEERAKKMTEKLTDAVNLDANQQKLIQDLYLKHFEKMHAYRIANKDKDKSELKQTMKEYRTELRKSIGEVLTDEQKSILKQKMKDREGRKKKQDN